MVRLALLVCLAAATSARADATTPAAPLTTAAAVRALTSAQAAARLPVRIEGTLTYIANQPNLFFIQDATGGVAATGPRDPAVRRQMRVGVTVRVEGVTAPGRLTPIVVPRTLRDPLDVTILDAAPSPIAPAPATLAELRDSPKRHGELVEVQGVVRSIRVETQGAGPQSDALVLTVASAGSRLDAAYLVWAPGQPLPQHWLGATVRLRGVFNSAGPDKQPSAMMRLLLGVRADATVLTPATPPTQQGIATLHAFDAAATADPPRVRYRGVVTMPISGQGIYLQDSTGGVWIDAPSVAPASFPKAGDDLTVFGFPVRHGGATALEDVQWQPEGRAELPRPAELNAEQALSGSYHAQLVSVDALVLEVSRLNEGPTLVLQSGERVFLARLPDVPEDRAVPGVSENSWVRVTGVCVNNRSPTASVAGASADVARPVSFHLMLPGPSAISVIHAPSWWTPERIFIATGIAVMLALAALAWGVALRRRVAEQTAQIRTHLHQHTVNEERMRIARELHDSLEQDLLGITMQLKATEKLLDRPERARESLTLASAMVRRSQAETHRAVWDLRERKGEGLVATLRSAVAGLTSGAGDAAGPAVSVEVTGAERELPPQVENHLLRVALESVTNAFKHAGAKKVTVSVAYASGRIDLAVKDDGKGFDADHPPLPNSGHFGLFGMKERAAKLHGELKVKSTPGVGTEIRLSAPIK